MTGIFAVSEVSFLDMSANLAALTGQVAENVKPSFEALGLALDQFVVESISLPDDLQKVIDQRIGMSMAGDMGKLTQFETAESLEEAAQNTGGTAGMGVGLGAGVAMAQAMVGQALPVQGRPVMAPLGGTGTTGSAAPAASTKFCIECGKPMPERAKFCPECGKQQ
jgi:membrane protease subunit (stomatin/prohibitin family)